MTRFLQHPENITHYRTYRIFGKSICIGFSRSQSSQILESELDTYPHLPDETPPDLTIYIAQPCIQHMVARNPSSHYEFEDGFMMVENRASIRFVFEDTVLSAIVFDIRSAKSIFYDVIYRWINLSFNTKNELAGESFHELGLLPLTYFFDDLFPIHASALRLANGSVILMGGVGGAGKTSLELHLALNKHAEFIADDFSIVGTSGHVYPNLSYPKIYGYNAVDNPALRKRLVANRQPLNSLHWSLHSLRGPDRVRRRIAPGALFKKVSNEPLAIDKYVLLAKVNQPFAIHEIPTEEAVRRNIHVLKTELNVFHRHIAWHEYNRDIQGLKPTRILDSTFVRWYENGLKALSSAKCYQALIPLDMPHHEFLRVLSKNL